MGAAGGARAGDATATRPCPATEVAPTRTGQVTEAHVGTPVKAVALLLDEYRPSTHAKDRQVNGTFAPQGRQRRGVHQFPRGRTRSKAFASTAGRRRAAR